jgi:hypothetical protein
MGAGTQSQGIKFHKVFVMKFFAEATDAHLSSQSKLVLIVRIGSAVNTEKSAQTIKRQACLLLFRPFLFQIKKKDIGEHL